MKNLFLLLLVFIMSPYIINAQLSSEFFDIEIKKVEPTGWIWDDGGSGADADVAFWKVNPSPGFFALGHLSTPFHQINESKGQKAPVTITLKPKPGYENLLAAPIGHDFVWNDAGSGARRDVHIWKMKCPTGYVALGDVVSDKDNAKPTDCRCIKESTTNSKGESVRLVTRANYVNFAKEGDETPRAFWTDAGSGADRDISVWLMYTNQIPAKKNQVYLVASTFRANKYHTVPPASDCFALVLDFPENDILEKVDLTEKYKLKGPQLPTNEELKASEVVQEYILPFFAVMDPDYPNQLDQFINSPTYKVKRTTMYYAVDSYQPVNDDTKNFSVSTGSTEESNYSNTLGVTVGASVTAGGKAGVPLVAEGEVSVTASVEVSYSHTWGGATSNYESKTFDYPQSITGGCFGALFQAKSHYQIYRAKTGEPVGGPVIVKINDLYSDEWCPEDIRQEKEKKKVAAGSRTINHSPNTIVFTIDAPPGKTVIFDGRLEIYDGKLVSAPVGVSMLNPTGPGPIYNSEKDKIISIANQNDIINTGNILGDSYTKSVWMQMAQVPDGGANNIISGNGAEHAFWAPGTFQNRLAAGHNGKWDYVKSANPVSAGWHHVAVTYDASQKQMKLYMDGELIDSKDGVPNYKKNAQNNTEIGGFRGGYNFRGSLKNVNIWNNVLSEEQVKSLYAATN